MIKASSHAHLPQPSLMLSQPVRLAPTFFCLSHSIARCQRGLLQTDIWPCWSPAEMTLGDSVHMSYQLTHSCLPHQCHFQPPCSVVPVPTVCMSSLAVLLMLSVHSHSLPLFLASILFFFEAQLSWNLLQPFFRLGWVPHPCVSIITLAGIDCCAYNLAPMGFCFVCLFWSFFFLVCKRLREKSCIEILTPTSAPAL